MFSKIEENLLDEVVKEDFYGQGETLVTSTMKRHCAALKKLIDKGVLIALPARPVGYGTRKRKGPIPYTFTFIKRWVVRFR